MASLGKLRGRAVVTGLPWALRLMLGSRGQWGAGGGHVAGGVGGDSPSQCTPGPPGLPGTGTWCCWLQESQRSPLSPGGHVQRPVCTSQWPPWHWQPEVGGAGRGEWLAEGPWVLAAPRCLTPGAPPATLTPAALLGAAPVAGGALSALEPPRPRPAVALPTLGVAVRALGGRSAGARAATPAALEAEMSFLRARVRLQLWPALRTLLTPLLPP